MPATIIDGNGSRRDQGSTCRQNCFVAGTGNSACLAAVLVGDDPASQKYVASKERTCTQLGIKGIVHRLPSTTSQDELRALIAELNADASVHGILVQLPLPGGLDEKDIMERIAPGKDVDGFGPVSLGHLVMDQPGFLACTPHGVIKLLDAYQVDLRESMPLWSQEHNRRQTALPPAAPEKCDGHDLP